MMDTILKRRSVRRFTSQMVGGELVDKILKAVMTAPSSKNVRSTRIAVSASPEVLEAVSKMRSTGTRFVAGAPLVFFVMGDDSATDLWAINAAISATILQLAAEELGLGSCWVHVDGRPHDESLPDGMTAEEYLRENISGLPPFRILCAVAVGHPAEQPHPRAQTDDEDKIFYI
jgi:nitroreductase